MNVEPHALARRYNPARALMKGRYTLAYWLEALCTSLR